MAENASINGEGVRVRAYFGERDRSAGAPLWSALLEYLRREGAAGATVTRGHRRLRRAQHDPRGEHRRSLIGSAPRPRVGR